MNKSAMPSSDAYIVHIPAHPDALDGEKMHSIIERQLNQILVGGSVMGGQAAEYLEQYPVVYIVHAQEAKSRSGDTEKQYIVYVGETNNIVSRTRQHFVNDVKKRSDWRDFANRSDAHQYVIGSKYFNKSLTLDIENRLMHYMSSVDSVSKINNRRTNAQGLYYTHEKLDALFHDIWLGLHRQDPSLFPAEKIILDSALFKASPFHELSGDQKQAEDLILDTLLAALDAETNVGEVQGMSTLVLVGGAAGTGKTVLLSHLFYRIMTEGVQEQIIEENAEVPIPVTQRPSAYILVNHNEQLHVYNQIATKLSLQKNDGQVVLKPSQFISKYSKHSGNRVERIVGEDGKKHYIPEDMADVVLVDEAHLLHTQGNQGYSGSNMLVDILKRAKVVVAVFDPEQILESRQRWKKADMALFLSAPDNLPAESDQSSHFVKGVIEGLPIRCKHVQLKQQFRIAANDSTIHWLEQLTHERILGPLPKDQGKRNPRAGETGESEWEYEPYDLRIFDSPTALMRAIREKAGVKARADGEPWGSGDAAFGRGLSRVLATYDWKYKDSGKNPDTLGFGGQWGVEMHRENGEWRMGPAQGHARGMGASDENYFFYPWNYQLEDTPEEKAVEKFSDLAWAEKPHTINEIGSTFTIQGFDLNYAGVILGPSVTYDSEHQRIKFHPEKSASAKATQNRRDMTESYAVENLQNEVNVLLTRGVHGLYIFAFDPVLRSELKKQCGYGR